MKGDQIFNLNCPYCGGQTEVRGPAHVVRGRCPSCGRHVVVKLETGSITHGTLVPTASVAIQLSSPSASSAELVALRKLVPDLKDESLRALKARVANHTEWVVEALTEGELERLKQQAKRRGVLLEIKPESVSLRRRLMGSTVRLYAQSARITLSEPHD